MKKLFICLFLLLITGCDKNNVQLPETNISLKNNIIEVYESIKVYDLISIENGEFITENTSVLTNELGNKDITVEYKGLDNITHKKTFNIQIVDKTKPTIMSSTNYTIKTGDKFEILDDIVCADNYDRNPICTIEGEYNTNKEGAYNLKILIKDASGNTNEKDIKLTVKDKITASNSPKYEFSDLIKKHKNENTEVGIDVSTWQGDINWKKVKDAGAEFVMIRIGFGHNSKNEIVVDNKFMQNIKGAKEAGLKVGVYFYSYAKNEEEAKVQAKWIVNTLNKEQLELPIAFDWEDWSDFNDYDINIYELNQIAKAFLTEIEALGYTPMLYSSASYLEKIWNLPEYTTWLAHYTDQTDYSKEYYIWQLSNRGKISGINGDVDLNVLYKK